MGIFDEIDFAELLNRVRATTDGDELRHLFFAALQRRGVKYCTGLMVSWGSDGSPVGTVVAQNLPVIPLSFEQACERRSQILSMTASLGDQPVEIDAQSVVSMGPDWRERFQEGRDEFDFEWCLVAPVWREGILRAVAFYLAEKKLSQRTIDWLITLSNVCFDHLEAGGRLPAPPSPLTARQRDVLAHCALGKSDWEIAQLLGISPVTAHEHVETAKRKLGVRTRVQAVALATQNRWI